MLYKTIEHSCSNVMAKVEILLVNATADEIDKDLSIAFAKRVSNVCFKVITQK